MSFSQAGGKPELGRESCYGGEQSSERDGGLE